MHVMNFDTFKSLFDSHVSANHQVDAEMVVIVPMLKFVVQCKM